MTHLGPHTRSPVALAALASAAIAAVVYLPTMSYGFVVDDLHQIVDNPWVERTGRWTEAWVRGVWDFEGRRSSYYRPMMYALYAGTHRLLGPEASGFHALNLVMHALASGIAAAAAFAIARRSGDALARRATWIAFLAGALFAVHPIHTEPVAWSAGLVDLGLGAAFLAAVALYVSSDDRFGAPYSGSVAAFGVALLFKEPAVALPAVVLAFDALYLWRSRGVTRTLVRQTPFAAVLVAYFAARAHALGGLAPTAGRASIGPATYLLAIPDLFARYIAKTLAPVGLNFWHVYESPESAFGLRGLVAMVVLAAFAALAWLSFRRSAAVAFALTLFVVPLLPAFALGALNQGIANAFTERYLYLPSFGAILAAVFVGALVVERGVLTGRTVAGIAAVAIALGTVGCLARIPVWRDSLTLWSDVVRKTPQSAVARANHGFALLYAKRIEEGEAELAHARHLDPGIAEEWVGKGVLYAREGLDKKALLAFHAALALDPGCASARFNLGVAYEHRGDERAALAEYRRAVALAPGNAAFRNNLGIAWARSGRIDLALAEFEEAARLAPDDPEIRGNLERARGHAP